MAYPGSFYDQDLAQSMATAIPGSYPDNVGGRRVRRARGGAMNDGRGSIPYYPPPPQLPPSADWYVPPDWTSTPMPLVCHDKDG